MNTCQTCQFYTPTREGGVPQTYGECHNDNFNQQVSAFPGDCTIEMSENFGCINHEMRRAS